MGVEGSVGAPMRKGEHAPEGAPQPFGTGGPRIEGPPGEEPVEQTSMTEKVDLTLKAHGLTRRQAVVGAGLVLGALIAIIAAGRATGEAPPLESLKEGPVTNPQPAVSAKGLDVVEGLPAAMEPSPSSTARESEEDPVPRWRAMTAEPEAKEPSKPGFGLSPERDADVLITNEKVKDLERQVEEEKESRRQLELQFIKEIAELKNKAEGGRSITTISGGAGVGGGDGHAGHAMAASDRPMGKGKIIMNPNAGAGSDESGVYFPSGSFAPAVLLSGAVAPDTDQQLPYPVLVRIQGSFVGPNRFKMPAHGCFALGRASGRAAARRAEIQIFQISCVFEDGTTMDRKINGWLTGDDGKLGIEGKVESHDSLYIAGTIAARTAQGFSQAIAASQLTTQLTPLGGAQQKVDGSLVSYGFSNAGVGFFEALAKLMEERIRRNVDTVTIEPGKECHVLLAQGFEGMPPDLALPVH